MKNQADSEKRARRAFLRGAGVIAAVLVPGAATALAGSAERTHDDAAAIRKLYRDYAASFATQRAEPGAEVQLRLLHDPAQPSEAIEVAADRQSARALFPCMVQSAKPLVGSASLLEMARLQGQHSETWWEAGVHELDCVLVDGQWTIRQVTFCRDGRVTLHSF